jgi:hypothetical protein
VNPTQAITVDVIANITDALGKFLADAGCPFSDEQLHALASARDVSTWSEAAA